MNTYKFRSECLHDITEFKKLTYKQGLPCKFAIELDNTYPDCLCILETGSSIEDIKQLFTSIPDSHVMRETIALESEYTGERK